MNTFLVRLVSTSDVYRNAIVRASDELHAARRAVRVLGSGWDVYRVGRVDSAQICGVEDITEQAEEIDPVRKACKAHRPVSSALVATFAMLDEIASTRREVSL